jgi:hypothetical protein
MPVTWSQIHAALGEPPGELTFAMIKAAIDEKVVETEALDWKSTLPGRDEPQLEEFAKDVAAMANTRGGLIVYGVAEQRGKGAAERITSVDVSERTQRRLRQLAIGRVHPMVAGLDLLPLASEDGSETVLVLAVPRSPDAPHIIGQQAKLGVPYRVGPETEWMRERDLARAYSERFATRTAELARLKDLVSDTSDQLDLDAAAWIVGVAAPRAPLPAVAGPPSTSEVTGVLEATLTRTLQVAPATSPERYRLVSDLGGGALDPRVGLRRWIVETNYTQDPDRRSDTARLELHHDGSVVLAAAIDGWYPPVVEDRNQVMVPLVESFAADLVALTETYARHLGIQTPMSARIDLTRGNANPFAAIEIRRVGGQSTGQYHQPPWSRSVRRFHPVEVEIPLAAVDLSTLRLVARQIAQDVLHQFGLQELVILPTP